MGNEKGCRRKLLLVKNIISSNLPTWNNVATFLSGSNFHQLVAKSLYDHNRVVYNKSHRKPSEMKVK